MPATLGVATKTIFLKDVDNGKIHEEFIPEGLSYTMTAAGAIVASNVVTVYVGGVAVSVTYATSSDATMTALIAAINVQLQAQAATAGIPALGVATPGTASTILIIKVVPNDPVNGIGLSVPIVTLGSGQTTFTNATVDKRIFKGMPVELNSDGNVQPLTVSTASTTYLGVALENAVAGQYVTVVCKGSAIVFGEANTTTTVPGPVAGVGFNNTTLYYQYTSSSVTATNKVGQSLDASVNIGDVIRVILD
jgi:hypothetical protein